MKVTICQKTLPASHLPQERSPIVGHALRVPSSVRSSRGPSVAAVYDRRFSLRTQAEQLGKLRDRLALFRGPQGNANGKEHYKICPRDAQNTPLLWPQIGFVLENEPK